jgi:hypothetical protein
MFKFMDLKSVLKWALGLAVIALKTPFVNFSIEVPELAKLVSDRLKDGKLSDEDLGDILAYIGNKIK